jgi:hypothetical protein
MITIMITVLIVAVLVVPAVVLGVHMTVVRNPTVITCLATMRMNMGQTFGRTLCGEGQQDAEINQRQKQERAFNTPFIEI